MNTILLSPLLLPFTILTFLPAIFLSAIIIFIISFKKKKNGIIVPSVSIDGVSTEDTGNNKDSLFQYIFAKEKVFYYRYLSFISFLFIIIIGTYDSITYCSYWYSMILHIAIIMTIFVIIKIIKQILLFYNIIIKHIFKFIISIIFIFLCSYYFSVIFFQDFHGFGDESHNDNCYNLKIKASKTKDNINTNIISNNINPVNFKYNPNGPYPSPLVGNSMINERGEVVDKLAKGTFKVIGTDETFKYQERYNFNQSSSRDYNDNAVNDCITLNCKVIYFMSASYNGQGRIALFTDKDNPIEGNISNIIYYSNGKPVSQLPNPHLMNDFVTYNISYKQNENIKNMQKSEDLCTGHKGGGFSCVEPRFGKNDNVILFDENNGGLRGLFSKNQLIKAELISYQYSMSPDTGEFFPVITR